MDQFFKETLLTRGKNAEASVLIVPSMR